MRKLTAVPLLLAALLTLAGCGSSDKIVSPEEAVLNAIADADYADPHAAAAASKAGIDIAGKTVAVKAMEPIKDDVIYDSYDEDLSCRVKVMLTYNEKFEDPDLTGITEGTAVIITVEGTSGFLSNNIYLFSSHFTVY